MNREWDTYQQLGRFNRSSSSSRRLVHVIFDRRLMRVLILSWRNRNLIDSLSSWPQLYPPVNYGIIPPIFRWW